MVAQTHIDKHRRDWTSCPFCDYSVDHNTWVSAKGHARTLVTKIVHGKHADLALVSICPMCLNESWVHVGFYSIASTHRGYKKSWRTRATVEEARRRLEALRDWGKGLCWRCENLSGGTVDTHCWRHCVTGFGPPDNECEKFVEEKTGKGA